MKFKSLLKNDFLSFQSENQQIKADFSPKKLNDGLKADYFGFENDVFHNYFHRHSFNLYLDKNNFTVHFHF